MKRQSRSFETALSAIACAVAVISLTLGAYVDFLLAAGIVVAVFALMVPLSKEFIWGYLLAFAASVILSFLFTGFVVGVMRLLPYAVFFGWHPLLNFLQKKYVKQWWLHAVAFAVKAVWFDLAMWLTWTVLVPIFGLEKMSWYQFVSENFYLILFAGGTVFFALYDVAIFFCQRSMDYMVQRIRR